MIHTRLPHSHHRHLKVCSTATPKQLASLRRGARDPVVYTLLPVEPVARSVCIMGPTQHFTSVWTSYKSPGWQVTCKRIRRRVTKSTLQVKDKVHPRTGHEGTEGGLRYSSTLSLTSVLGSGEWSTPHPGRFTPVKVQVPVV
jgi:hypothetical protein